MSAAAETPLVLPTFTVEKLPVWYGGEDSDTWHTSYGGGIWLSFLDYRSTVSAYIAHSKEGDIFHVGGGFTF